MEKSKQLTIKYVPDFHAFNAQNYTTSQAAIDAKNKVLDYIIKKIILKPTE